MTRNIMKNPVSFARQCVGRGLDLATVLDQLDDKPGTSGKWRETVVRWMTDYQNQKAA